MNYFREMQMREQNRSGPDTIISFERRTLSHAEEPKWKYSTKPLSKVEAKFRGRIEVDGVGMLQVDFANKYVGMLE